MSEVFNTQGEITEKLNGFFTSIYDLSKPQQKLLSHIIVGIIESESVVTHDIIKKLKGNFSFVKNESNHRRLRRFFNSKFDIDAFYDAFINHVFSNFYTKHNDNRVHISIDHMFCRNQFVTLCFTFRIGKQGIPIWFRSYKYADPEAFNENLIIEGINYVNNLFKKHNVDIIFLADRWFNSVNLMQCIDTLGHTYIFRSKTNIKVLIYDKKEDNHIWKYLSDITPYVHHASWYDDIKFTIKSAFSCKLAISKSSGTDDPWYLITNGDVKRAIKDYGYRFGSIETVFKNQKSNGFYLESTNVKNLNAYRTLYGLACVALVWLVIIGLEYLKSEQKKDNLITDVKRYKHPDSNYKSKPTRIISLFNLGLTYFNLALNSLRNLKLRYNFILRDY